MLILIGKQLIVYFDNHHYFLPKINISIINRKREGNKLLLQIKHKLNTLKSPISSHPIDSDFTVKTKKTIRLAEY